MKAVMRICAVLALAGVVVTGSAAADPALRQAQYQGSTSGGAAATEKAGEKDKAAAGEPRPIRKPAVILPPPAGDPPAASPGAIGCAWLGKRMLSLLIRDDAMGANDFTPFYQRFGCPEDHLAKAFTCVVTNNGHAGDGDVLANRVDQCWLNPDTRFEAPKETATDKPKPPADAKEPPK